MELDLSRRVNLAVRGWIGAAIIFEKQEDDEGVPVRILRGPEAARRWIDGHYDGVDWDSPHRASVLVG